MDFYDLSTNELEFQSFHGLQNIQHKSLKLFEFERRCQRLLATLSSVY